jgi:hypothetical protein
VACVNADLPLQFVQAVFSEPTEVTPYPEADTVVVGDGFYQAVQYLPPGKRKSFQRTLPFC